MLMSVNFIRQFNYELLRTHVVPRTLPCHEWSILHLLVGVDRMAAGERDIIFVLIGVGDLGEIEGRILCKKLYELMPVC